MWVEKNRNLGQVTFKMGFAVQNYYELACFGLASSSMTTHIRAMSLSGILFEIVQQRSMQGFLDKNRVIRDKALIRFRQGHLRMSKNN